MLLTENDEAELVSDEREVGESDIKKVSKESIHFGEDHIDEEEIDFTSTTWTEVYQACCIHTSQEWMFVAAGVCTVVFLLYFFLFGLELLGTGAKIMSGCSAGALFGDETNAVAGLMVGIVATVFLQSSSTTTSIIVSLVPDVISVNQGKQILQA